MGDFEGHDFKDCYVVRDSRLSFSRSLYSILPARARYSEHFETHRVVQ